MISEREKELEATLRDIIKGCDMMLQIEQLPSVRRYIQEVRRVASAPLPKNRFLVGERSPEIFIPKDVP